MKPTAAMAAATALALTGAFYVAINLRRSVEIKVLSEARERQAVMAQTAARTVEAYLHVHTESLLLLSISPLVRHGDPKQLPAALSEALRLMEEPYLEAVSLYDGRGQLRYSTSNTDLPAGRGRDAFLTWATAREREGKVFVFAFERPPRHEGALGRLGGVIAVALDPPPTVQRQGGLERPVSGFLTLTFDMGALLNNALASHESSNPESAIWLVAPDGLLVFHQRHPEMVLRSIARQDKSCSQCHTTFEHVRQAVKTEQGSMEYAVGTGPRMVAAYTPVRFANVTWTMVASVPLDQVTAVTGTFGWQIILLMGLAVVTVIGGAGVIYRTHKVTIRAQEEARYWRDREALNRRLQESEERYRTIVDSSRDLIATYDGDGVITFVNQRALKLLGCDAEDAVGTSFERFIEADDLPAARRAFASAASGNSPADIDLRVHTKRGTTHTLSVRFVFTAETAGRAGVLGFGREVTAEKEAAKQAKNLEQQFFRAQKMEGIGRLAGGVAHDFNNLLTAILGYGELVQEQVADNGPLRADIQEIMKAARSATSLTRQLLAFSRKQVLQPVLLDLNVVVAETSKMLSRLIGEDIELVTVLASESCRVRGDLGQIEQVLVNLAVNARDAMPGGGRLTIETATVDLDDTYVQTHRPISAGRYGVLVVSDTGCGMTPEVQAHLFEPFFTTKEVGRGTGLGLATVYGIVAQSGGTIWVYSEPGRGSTFKIYLPRAGESLEEPALSDAQPPPYAATETVLLVDDDDGVRESTRRILERAGYVVLAARGPAEALAVCERHDVIHVLVSDIVMPGMDGPEVARRVAKLHPHIRVVHMSGHTDHAMVADGRLEPGVVFLQKPFTAATLGQAVRRALEIDQAEKSQAR